MAQTPKLGGLYGLHLGVCAIYSGTTVFFVFLAWRVGLVPQNQLTHNLWSDVATCDENGGTRQGWKNAIPSLLPPLD